MKNPRTSAALAKKDSESLKSTIPEAIVYTLKLNNGDVLEWDSMHYNGDLIAFFRKVSP